METITCTRVDCLVDDNNISTVCINKLKDGLYTIKIDGKEIKVKISI